MNAPARKPRPPRGARTAPQAPPEPEPTPPVDPLAAFRDQEAPDERGPLPGVDGSGEPEPEDQEPADVPGLRTLVTPEDQDEAVRQAVTAMHNDTTALGFLHKGSACGCAYISRVIVQTVLPASLVEDDPEPETGSED